MKAVFLSRWLGNPYKRILASSLKEINIDVKEHLWRIFFLPKVLANGRPAIVHFHTLHPFFLASGKMVRLIKFLTFTSQILFLKIIGTRSIWTVHEWSNKINPDKGSLFSKQEAYIIGKLFHAIIVHCESTGKEISNFFGLSTDDTVVVIPHGNYISQYPNSLTQAQARKELALSSKGVVFLVFGGIYPYKGILEAIDAFQNLHDEEATLVIAGEIILKTPQQHELKRAIEEKVASSINIRLTLTAISESDVQLYMNACDCVVTPYKTFTTSGVTLLAMSFKKACIAPKKGFFDDILDERDSILYSPDDPDGLRHAMQEAIQRKGELASMGKYGFETAKQWGWDYVAEQTSIAYK